MYDKNKSKLLLYCAYLWNVKCCDYNRIKYGIICIDHSLPKYFVFCSFIEGEKLNFNQFYFLKCDFLNINMLIGFD